MMDTKEFWSPTRFALRPKAGRTNATRLSSFRRWPSGITRLTSSSTGKEAAKCRTCKLRGEAPKDVPAVTVECFCVADNSGTLATSHRSLTEAIETSVTTIWSRSMAVGRTMRRVRRVHLRCRGRTIQLEFNGRYSDVHTSATHFREATMAHPYHHSLSSVKKWANCRRLSPHSQLVRRVEKIIADFRHRALRHHAEASSWSKPLWPT